MGEENKNNTEPQPNVPSNAILKPPRTQKRRQIIVFGITLVFIFLAVLLTFRHNATQQGNNTLDSPLLSVTPMNTPTRSDQIFDRNITNILYTVSEKGFNEIATFKSSNLSPYYSHIPPFYNDENGLIYLADHEKISVYRLDTKEEEEVYRNSDQGFRISGFSVEGKILYIGLSPDNMRSNGYIEEFIPDEKKSRKIGPLVNVMYGGLHHLFKTTSGDDVIGSFGGDGCGGYGEIKLITQSGTKLVAETGGGCNESPRYFGTLAAENKLILISVVKGSWSETESEKLDMFYTKDIYTGEEKMIFDLKPYTERLISYFEDEKNNRIYLMFKDEIWSVNASNGQVESREAVHENIAEADNYFSLASNDRLYFLRQDPITDNFNMVLKVANIKTGEITSYDWGRRYPISGIASILGFRQKQPLINLYIYPKDTQ